MEILEIGKDIVKRYGIQESYQLDASRYIIQQCESHDDKRAQQLLQRGFRFHDRFFREEINIKSTESMRNQMPDLDLWGGVSFKLDHRYSSDMYNLAYLAFEYDRRFHLGILYDQEKANKVKQAYINYCQKQNMFVYSAKKDRELLGYIIVDLYPDLKLLKIMLGVTRPGIKGKMTAIPLYNGLLNYFAQSVNGEYKKYCGYVSTLNVASINLHYRLGANITGVIDEYILER